LNIEDASQRKAGEDGAGAAILRTESDQRRRGLGPRPTQPNPAGAEPTNRPSCSIDNRSVIQSSCPNFLLSVRFSSPECGGKVYDHSRPTIYARRQRATFATSSYEGWKARNRRTVFIGRNNCFSGIFRLQPDVLIVGEIIRERPGDLIAAEPLHGSNQEGLKSNTAHAGWVCVAFPHMTKG